MYCGRWRSHERAAGGRGGCRSHPRQERAGDRRQEPGDRSGPGDAALRRTPAHRRRAGHREDDAGESPGQIAGVYVSPAAVHPRSAADRHYRSPLLQSENSGIRVPAGPVFTSVLLADEINRATPRTQAALLECMEERQVTLEIGTVPLGRPFMVIATQNPIGLQGTFPLPEAQLDRFLMQLPVGYPSAEEEAEILRRFRASNP